MTHRPVVGIDASRAIAAERTGTETYSFQILQALARRNPEWDYRTYINAGGVAASELSDTTEIRAIPFPRLWTHGRLSVEMARHRPDLLFVPAHVIPLIHPPSVVTIHDLGYLHIPDAHPPRQRRMLDLTTRWSARAATRIITPSKATARDLMRCYGVAEERISIIPHGIVSPATGVVSPEEIERIRQIYDLDRPFVLSVGTVQPRKNYGRLAAAVRRLVDEGRDVELAIGGRPGWFGQTALAEIEAAGLGERLHLLGYVPAGDLFALYAAANVFALVSLYEGFGMPALEAMSAGTPVVVAGGSSLPEITGDAGLTVDPHSIEEIVAALRHLFDDGSARARLARAGLEHAGAFTWDRAATQTETVFRQALTTGRS